MAGVPQEIKILRVLLLMVRALQVPKFLLVLPPTVGPNRVLTRLLALPVI